MGWSHKNHIFRSVISIGPEVNCVLSYISEYASIPAPETQGRVQW